MWEPAGKTKGWMNLRKWETREKGKLVQELGPGTMCCSTAEKVCVIITWVAGGALCVCVRCA